MSHGRKRRTSHGWRGVVAAFIALGAIVACASGGDQGGSNTNWIQCRVDSDCPAAEACVSSRCAPVDAGRVSDRPTPLRIPGADASRDGVCVGEAYRSELAPVALSLLDAYLLVDQSSSMGDALPSGTGTWWSALQSGLETFVNAPSAAGMAVGIQYFPLGGIAPGSCAADYATPEVPVAALPGNAAAMVTSLRAHAPTGFTPTGPALSGAIAHMKTWAVSHADRVPVVVLVTDGFPTECPPMQITDIAAIARAGASTEPRIRTFVVGLNLGASGSNLNAIAEAGGTRAAVLISSGDLATSLAPVMLSIAVAPLQCAFTLPPLPDGGAYDPSLVTLRYTPAAGGAAEDIPKVASLDDCTTGGSGFYLDPPEAPKRAVACPGTCAADDGGTLELVILCPPSTPSSR